MSELKQKGTIEVLQDTEQISDKFKKRTVVLNTGGDYPQSVPFEFVQGNVDKLDGFGVGEEVTIHFNLRGQAYNGKYYPSLQGWKIEADI